MRLEVGLGDGIEASSKPVVNYNNIWGYGEYDFRATLQASDSIDARNNWWGTFGARVDYGVGSNPTLPTYSTSASTHTESNLYLYL